MRRPTATALTIVLALATALVLAAPASAAKGSAPAMTDLLVARRPSAVAASVSALVDRGRVVAERAHNAQFTTISVPTADVGRVTAELAADPQVAYVEPDVQARIAATPSDPFYYQQWGTPLVQVPGVWDATTGSSNVVIAVIDTGVNAGHADLAGVSYVAGYDFVDNDTTPDDGHGHGTAAVGVISSQHNTTGTAGICPRCRIMPLKAMGADGTGSHGAIAAAIHHAVDNGADIINLSLGSEGSTSTLHNAVKRAQAAGILVVAAAGNAGVSTPFYPAAYPEALGVAATDSGDNRYPWSNYGTWVSVAAPGCNYTAAYAPDSNQLGYANFCGTSSSAPFTAGVAGLLAAASPGATGADLTTALQTTALSRSFVTSGRVDATAALAALTLDDPEPGDVIDETVEPPPEDDTTSGGDGPTDDPSTDDPVDTATSVTPSATSIAYGQSVEIAGRVSTSSGSPQGAMVTLERRPAGEQAWSEVAEQPADQTGTVVFTQEPQATADYRLRFDGTSAQAASLSDVVTIAVAPVVEARTVRVRVLAGKPAVVRGSVTPAQRGMAVVLQRKTPRGWREVVTGRTGSAGGFRLATPSRVGRSRYRVLVPETTALAAELSRPIRSIGERAKIVKVRADARGDDRRNLNGEFVVLRNTGKTPIQLRGWKVRSASTRAAFSLRKYRLQPGDRVKVHSGKGRTRDGHLYLRAGREVWRNHRDTAVLRHVSGPVAMRVSW